MDANCTKHTLEFKPQAANMITDQRLGVAERAEARASLFESIAVFTNRVYRHSTPGCLSAEFERTHNPELRQLPVHFS